MGADNLLSKTGTPSSERGPSPHPHQILWFPKLLCWRERKLQRKTAFIIFMKLEAPFVRRQNCWFSTGSASFVSFYYLSEVPADSSTLFSIVWITHSKSNNNKSSRARAHTHTDSLSLRVNSRHAVLGVILLTTSTVHVF